jgi:hypothetical protein
MLAAACLSGFAGAVVETIRSSNRVALTTPQEGSAVTEDYLASTFADHVQISDPHGAQVQVLAG